MKTIHYLVKPLFAKSSNIPASFVGTVLATTDKAVYIYGHGEMDPLGTCAKCGRTLSHPGSILVGIGPECLHDWSARDIRLDHMTEEDKKYLKSITRAQIVDQWIPRSVIKMSMETEKIVTPPEDHPKLKPKETKEEEVASKKSKIWKEKIAIQFTYNQDTVNKVKTLDGRKYESEGKYWTCPIHVSSIQKLKEWGFSIDDKMKEILDENTIPLEKSSFKLSDIGLKRELFPFQKEGVEFLELKKGRALVGDEMGLGKTIQALAYLQLHPELRPAIIVCPASLKLNWAKEIQSTMTKRCTNTILVGKSPDRFPPLQEDILIINYDIIESWLLELQKIKPKIVIADEAHYFKSNTAKRTKAMKQLVKVAPHFIALTGTPIMNRPIEIYNAVSMINPFVVPNYWKFTQRYCGAKYNGFGWDFNGSSHTEELHELLTSTVMIRRKKVDVLKDLPDKLYSTIPMELDNQMEYDTAEGNFIEFVRSTKGEEAAERASNAAVITQIEGLKQLAVKGKMNAVIEWVHDFLESGEKLVLFAIHKSAIDMLMEEFKGVAVKIDGSVTTEDRNKAVEAFQLDDRVRLFIGNIKAAGVGLTLTAASNVAFIEYPWTPGELKQAEDRCHRIGQKNSVNIHHLVAYHTIEGEIVDLLDKKTKVLDAVLDGHETHEDSLLSSLIKSALKRK